MSAICASLKAQADEDKRQAEEREQEEALTHLSSFFDKREQAITEQ